MALNETYNTVVTTCQEIYKGSIHVYLVTQIQGEFLWFICNVKLAIQEVSAKTRRCRKCIRCEDMWILLAWVTVQCQTFVMKVINPLIP